MAILDWIYPKKCLGCGRSGEYVCGECRHLVQHKDLSLAYKGVIRQALKEVKYRGSYDMVRELIEIWSPVRPEGEWVVTGVPMWEGKKRKRGYNQAELVARAVAERWGTTYLELLVRKRETQPMYGLSREERLANVRGAFALSAEVRDIPDLKMIGVVVIDDVRTSGATLQECAATLENAGWSEVRMMSLAA